MLRRTLSKAKNADFSRNSGEIAPAKVHHGQVGEYRQEVTVTQEMHC
jgi:hypothetical protein